ncbi:hypothetical protein [Vibrio harveyi]|uniref:hypothetical protein n=1 Tax=Vibrio harveyi TaxID=669 RepID=UPI001263103B|nr:hypothetical protein [Vibrio harveyi]QFQ77513.1 hypothetical protein F9277_08900 [Vibrio harveyi]
MARCISVQKGDIHEVYYSSVAFFLCRPALSAGTILASGLGGVKNITFHDPQPAIKVATYNIAAARVGSVEELTKAMALLRNSMELNQEVTI